MFAIYFVSGCYSFHTCTVSEEASTIAQREAQSRRRQFRFRFYESEKANDERVKTDNSWIAARKQFFVVTNRV